MNVLKAYNRKRLFLSITLALGIHGIIFILLNYLLPPELGPEEIYTGPVLVTVELPESKSTRPQTKTFGKKSRMEEEVSIGRVEKTAPAVEKERVEEESFKSQQVGKQREVPVEKSTAVQERPSKPSPSTSQIVGEKPLVKEKSEISEGEFAPWFEEQSQETIKTPQISPEELAKRHLAEVEKGETTGEVFKPGVLLEKEKPLVDVEKLESSLAEGKTEEIEPGKESRVVTSGGKEGGGGREYSEISWDNPASGRKLLTEIPKPDIPQWVKKRGINLKVVVRFSVSHSGIVSNTEIIKSSGFPEVDAAVLSSVRKLRFNPVKEMGEEWGEIPFIIKLSSETGKDF